MGGAIMKTQQDKGVVASSEWEFQKEKKSKENMQLHVAVKPTADKISVTKENRENRCSSFIIKSNVVKVIPQIAVNPLSPTVTIQQATHSCGIP